MNTDMNQYLIFRYASTVVTKMTAYQLCCAGLARSPFVLTEHISSNICDDIRGQAACLCYTNTNAYFHRYSSSSTVATQPSASASTNGHS